MNKHCAVASQIISYLANRFQIRLPLNIADGSADFTEHKIFIGNI